MKYGPAAELDYPVVPFVITYILTPLMEAEFRRGLELVQDNALAFLERPLFVVLLVVVLLVVVLLVVVLLVVGALAFLGASNVFSRTKAHIAEPE